MARDYIIGSSAGMTVTSGPPRAGRREWIGLGVIALPCLLYSMDLTVLNLALPSLSADLAPTSAQLLWIVDIYGFLVAGSLITMGTLGDRIGRRKVLLIGAAAFGIGSVARRLLDERRDAHRHARAARARRRDAGAVDAVADPQHVPRRPQQRTVAIGIWISSYSVGAAIGPLVGGILLEHFWWGSVFLIGVPVMVLLLVVGPMLLPEYPGSRSGPDRSAQRGPVARRGAAGHLRPQADRAGRPVAGWPRCRSSPASPSGWRSCADSSALADPLIDLRLFRAPAFSASLATYTLATFVAFGIFIFIGQYLQLVLGLSPLHAGLWTMPFGGRVHRRLDADAGDRAPRSSGLRHGRRPGRRRRRLRHADAGGRSRQDWRSS